VYTHLTCSVGHHFVIALDRNPRTLAPRISLPARQADVTQTTFGSGGDEDVRLFPPHGLLFCSSTDLCQPTQSVCYERRLLCVNRIKRTGRKNTVWGSTLVRERKRLQQTGMVWIHVTSFHGVRCFCTNILLFVIALDCWL
jgi:hypothetical protein